MKRVYDLSSIILFQGVGSMDILEITSIIGTIAFSFSGALVAIEEKYDLLGIAVLGFVTAFGGGALRNLILGLSMDIFWSQTTLFYVSFATIGIVYLFPKKLSSMKMLELISDAIGLAAFSIQGALYGLGINGHIGPVIMAALLTGTGGGLIRDLLAGKKPSVLCAEIYGSWSILIAIALYVYRPTNSLVYLFIIALTVLLRVVGLTYDWNLPKSKFNKHDDDNSHPTLKIDL